MFADGLTFNKRKKGPASFKIENEYHNKGYKLIAGLDEVGRGAWAGPLVAAAVILPSNLKIGKIFESKSLNKMQRAELNSYLKVKALSYGIGETSIIEIQELGLTKALNLAYERALKKLTPQPDLILLDGLPVKSFSYEHEAIIKGDQKAKCIAAASIIAKEYRDALMTRLSPQYPQYGFHLHKGYGTARHQQAIKEHGVLDIHRKNYSWIQNFLNQQEKIKKH